MKTHYNKTKTFKYREDSTKNKRKKCSTVEPLYYKPLNYGHLRYKDHRTVYKLDFELQSPPYSILLQNLGSIWCF